VDPIVGEPIPKEEMDFTLYQIKALDEIAGEWWVVH